MTTLKGKACLITGASSGIGAAVARRFAKEGARLCLVARSTGRLRALAQELASPQGTPLVVEADVGLEQQVKNAVSQAMASQGGIDVLVNCAGTVYFTPIDETDESQWNDVIDSNLKGTFLFCKHLVPGMLERGYGDIVNIGSIASHQGFENSTAYCAAKHGVLGFSRALALEVRKRGLRVITVSPGSVNTPLWDPMEWTPDRSKMLHADEVAEAVHAALTVSSTAAVDELIVMPQEGVL